MVAVPRIVPLLPPPPVRLRMPPFTIVPPVWVLCTLIEAVPAPLFTSAPVPDKTPLSAWLPAPSRLRSNPPLATAPLMVRVPLLLMKDCGAPRVDAMVQALFPAWFNRPHWRVTGFPDRVNPPFAKATRPTDPSRLFVLVWRTTP